MTKCIGVFCLGLLVSCSNYGQLTFITKLPKKLDENSGITMTKDSTLWIIEDQGNTDKIYQVDFDGKLLKEFKVKNAKNRDWEDLAKDYEGNVYIGDFGNNKNDRKNLRVYKIPDPTVELGDKIEAEEIKFHYPEQTAFPPKHHSWNFDVEAFFYHNNALFLITKNRSRPFTGEAFLYKIPAQEGAHEAQLVSKFTTCKDQDLCEVTSADISPDGKKIVLLGYGMLWVFTDFTFDDFTKGTMQSIDLGASTQLESVCFMNNNTILLADEERGITGRNLYSYRID